ncbi:MAG: hypothetical protein PVH61_30835 [Candidatus Aminicenantes bacterium]|jgi:hypothetical protein
MNYLKMFKDVGIIANDSNFFKIIPFDSDNNCQKYSESLFEVVEKVYIDNDIKTALSGFIMELKDFYNEVGFNLGCFFIERNHKKKLCLNCDTNKIEMKEILNINGYLDSIFNRMWDIRLKIDFESLFSDNKNRISIMKQEFILKYCVTEEAINFVLNSAELSKLSYFLIKTGFKCGVFICFSLKNFNMHLSEDIGNYIPVDWPVHVLS